MTLSADDLSNLVKTSSSLVFNINHSSGQMIKLSVMHHNIRDGHYSCVNGVLPFIDRVKSQSTRKKI